MSSRVDARDVLDPDARVRAAFLGRVVGHYLRTGPNAWDDYQFVAGDGGEVEVFPGIDVQLERFGARLRLRKEGRVLRVEWQPSAEEQRQLRRADPREVRRTFMERYLEPFDEAQGQTLATFISRKLE